VFIARALCVVLNVTVAALFTSLQQRLTIPLMKFETQGAFNSDHVPHNPEI